MARKPKYKEGMVVHPSLGERVADVIIGIILLACMALAIIPMWHTLMASLSDGNLLLAHNGVLSRVMPIPFYMWWAMSWSVWY